LVPRSFPRPSFLFSPFASPSPPAPTSFFFEGQIPPGRSFFSLLLDFFSPRSLLRRGRLLAPGLTLLNFYFFKAPPTSDGSPFLSPSCFTDVSLFLPVFSFFIKFCLLPCDSPLDSAPFFPSRGGPLSRFFFSRPLAQLLPFLPPSKIFSPFFPL